MKYTLLLAICTLSLFVSSQIVAMSVPDRHVSVKMAAEKNGLAAFYPHSVSVNDDGNVRAQLRSVPLASGTKVTVSFTGDALIGFAVGEMSASASRANQDGPINAPGQPLMMEGKAASSVLDRMINLNGIIEAQSVATQNGKIMLVGIADR